MVRLLKRFNLDYEVDSEIYIYNTYIMSTYSVIVANEVDIIWSNMYNDIFS